MGAIVFAVVIGLIIHLLYRREEADKAAQMADLTEETPARGLAQNGLYFLSIIGILVFAIWGAPAQAGGFFEAVYASKWVLTSFFALGLAVILPLWFGLPWSRMGLIALPTAGLVLPQDPTIAFVVGFVGLSAVISFREDELGQWFSSSWIFAKQIMPLLFIGVLVAGPAPRAARRRRLDPFGLGQRGRGRQFPGGEFFRFLCRGVHVFRHTH